MLKTEREEKKTKRIGSWKSWKLSSPVETAEEHRTADISPPGITECPQTIIRMTMSYSSTVRCANV